MLILSVYIYILVYNIFLRYIHVLYMSIVTVYIALNKC